MAYGQILQYADGNPGAYHFLEKVLRLDNPYKGEVMIFLSYANSGRDELKISGASLYVLYADLCDKDLDKLLFIIRNCRMEIIREACNRYDRSGKEILADYFKDYVKQIK